MRLICVALILFVAFSCTSRKENAVLLINNVYFELEEAEQQVSIDSTATNEFKSLLKPSIYNIPLFKHIKSDDYTIFIGLPFNISDDKLSRLTPLRLDLQENPEFKSRQFKIYNDQDTNILEQIISLNNSTFYALYLAKSELILDSLINASDIEKRFVVD